MSTIPITQCRCLLGLTYSIDDCAIIHIVKGTERTKVILDPEKILLPKAR